jgi:hypothetical protein
MDLQRSHSAVMQYLRLEARAGSYETDMLRANHGEQQQRESENDYLRILFASLA